MKTRAIMMVVVLSTIITGMMAQQPAPKKELTPEQREEIRAIHDKYKPTMDKLKEELKGVHDEQKTLLSVKSVDEKAVYANIDKMGAIKKEIAKQKLSLSKEKQAVAPHMCKPACKGPHKGPRQGHGECTGQGPRSGQGMNAQGQRGQGMNGQGQPGQGMHGEFRYHAKNLEALNLSEEQKSEIEKIRAKHISGITATKDEIKALEEKDKTVDDKLASLDEMNALKTKLQKQKMAMMLDRMEVLTEEQRQKAIEMRAENGPRQGPKPGPKKGPKKCCPNRGPASN